MSTTDQTGGGGSKPKRRMAPWMWVVAVVLVACAAVGLFIADTIIEGNDHARWRFERTYKEDVAGVVAKLLTLQNAAASYEYTPDDDPADFAGDVAYRAGRAHFLRANAEEMMVPEWLSEAHDRLLLALRFEEERSNAELEMVSAAQDGAALVAGAARIEKEMADEAGAADEALASLMAEFRFDKDALVDAYCRALQAQLQKAVDDYVADGNELGDLDRTDWQSGLSPEYLEEYVACPAVAEYEPDAGSGQVTCPAHGALDRNVDYDSTMWVF